MKEQLLKAAATGNVSSYRAALTNKRKSDRFGNAWLMKNVFEKTFEAHANRTASIAPVTSGVWRPSRLPISIPYDNFVKERD